MKKLAVPEEAEKQLRFSVAESDEDLSDARDNSSVMSTSVTSTNDITDSSMRDETEIESNKSHDRSGVR